MAVTNSLNFPNMIDVARNRVGVVEDRAAIVSRSKLLLLTEPTELYNNLIFGVGLKRYLWQYNNTNTFAIIQDRIINQLREFEPYCDAEATQFSNQIAEDINTTISAKDWNTLKMTIGLVTTLGDTLEVKLDE